MANSRSPVGDITRTRARHKVIKALRDKGDLSFPTDPHLLARLKKFDGAVLRWAHEAQRLHAGCTAEMQRLVAGAEPLTASVGHRLLFDARGGERAPRLRWLLVLEKGRFFLSDPRVPANHKQSQLMLELAHRVNGLNEHSSTLFHAWRKTADFIGSQA